MKNYVQRGEVLNYTIPSATEISSGDLVEVGSLVGVAVTGGSAGEVIAVQLEGVFELPKLAGAINVGDKLYSDGDGSVTTDADDGASPTPNPYVFAGHAFEGAASGDATVSVRLN